MKNRNSILRLGLIPCLLTGLLMVFHQPVQAAGDSGTALVLTLDGSLTQGMVDYLDRGLQIAERGNMEMVIIQIDTPGGSIDWMTAMEEAIQASPVPVILYVSPSGGMAGSAGTVITLAGDVVAMAPGTIIGAASPVSSTGEDLGDTEKAKITNAMVAIVQTLTENRSEAAQALAADTIRNATAISAEDAKQIGLADFIATDLNDLLLQLNGVKVTTPGENSS